MLFSLEEFEARTRAVQSLLDTQGIDLAVIDQSELFFYLVGYSTSENMYRACLVPRAGQPIMVLRKIDEGACREKSWLKEIVGFDDWDDPVSVMADVIRKKGWPTRRIGLDETSYSMTIVRYRSFQKQFPNAQIANTSGIVQNLRARKSQAEIEYLRKAASIADATFADLVAFVSPAVSVRACHAFVAEQFIRRGAEPGVIGFTTRCGGSVNLHADLDDAPLAVGDVLHVELIPKFKGYSARLIRPIVLGRPNPDLADRAHRVIEIQDRQLNAMKPGVQARDIDRIVRDGMISAGLREAYTNISGYSVGYYPLYTCRSSDFTHVFLPKSEWTLQPGMTFHMYTHANELAFSETVAVTDSGCDRLTRSQRCLFSTSY